MPLLITSADSESRTITGRVVTWNETGSTSAGLTTFKPESIATKNVKLLLEHDRTRPIGKVLSMTATEQGIDATFKIAETTAGNDALIEAATGLRDGFSVGVKVNAHDFVDGVLVVLLLSPIPPPRYVDPGWLPPFLRLYRPLCLGTPPLQRLPSACWSCM